MIRSMDPIELEVMKHLLQAVPLEMGEALARSAFSPNIRERRDLSCGIFSASGELVRLKGVGEVTARCVAESLAGEEPVYLRRLEATEATPLDEPASAKVNDEVSPLEKGFEFTPVASEAPVASEENTRPDATLAQGSLAAASTASDSASQPIELSPALIDDIVRRVIAQMSDAAVREIAWEVVPDCVERVIKEMTKQELPKRA